MRLTFTLFLALFMNAIFGQQLTEKYWETFKPRSVGPAGMSGRVTAIDVVADNPEEIYIGTASGGLWKSEDGGIRWKPIFDEVEVNSVGAIAIQQNNPDVIWAGTGEGNPRNSHTSGAGIYKSIDGGVTWKLMGLEQSKTIHRIIIHRDNPDVVFVASLGSAWGPNEERGVFRTIDGGKTWSKILYNNETTGCADLIVDPSNPNKLIAAMWQYQRWPYHFKSGGEGSGMYITYDAGETWTKRTQKEGIPKGEIGRIGLAISAANPNKIYALIESKSTALYHSLDGGLNWKKITDKNIGNRPFYYADIYADPSNENTLFNLYSVTDKSIDGGKTFKTIMYYSKVHPDHHAFYIHPKDSKFLINGNDGGLNISHDGGKTWRFAENLPLGQFYHINIDNDIPYNIYGGMQDNGSWVGPAYVWRSGGIRNSYWNEVMFGDGFDVVPDAEDNRYGFAMYQGGNVSRYDKETGQNHKIKPMHPKGLPLRFNWNGAIAQDPFNNSALYFGSQYVHYTADKGNSWKIISPDLTTNDTAFQKQATSGGLTIDATQAENYTSIICVSPSSINKDIIWVGTDDGNIQLTINGGADWSLQNSKLKGLPKNGWIPQIITSTFNEKEAWVVVNNYRNNDWKPYLYYTNNSGESWRNLVDESKVSGHCLSFVQDPVEPNLLFLGTENGLYFSLNKGDAWQRWWKGYPHVSSMDMKIQAREKDLVVGTFGRAAFVFDDIEPLRSAAEKGGEDFGELKMFAVRDAYLAYNAAATGTRFTADAIFKGDNRKRGALVSYWKSFEKAEEIEKKDEAKEKKDRKKEKLHVVIFNQEGDTIRNFIAKPDTGLNRMYWDLSRNGVRYPSYAKPKKDAEPSRGPGVSPGKYLIKMIEGSIRDSSWVNVLRDPRVEFNAEGALAKDKMIDSYFEIVKAATKTVDQLNDAKLRIENINKQLASLEDSVKKDIIKSGKAIQDSIKTYHELFMLPKGFKGYDHVTVRINNKLYDVMDYMLSPEGGPSEQAELAMNMAKTDFQVALKRINKMFETDWIKYQAEVEKAEPKLFKEYKRINLDEN
tara:strand:- start:7809 stop:10970 length:3162 start_codon:yes stop_codon:yes gene_type:complete